MMLALAVLLLSAQEESFDTVARILSLPEKEAAAAAERIRDPFYREVATSELEARSKLGEKFGREPARITVQGNRPPEAYLEDLKAAGLQVRQRWVEAFEQKDALDLAMKDVTPLEALRQLCVKVKAVPYGSSGLMTLSGTTADTPMLAYRNFYLHVTDVRGADVVDFSGPPRRGIVFSLTLLWDAGVEIAATAASPVILEAVDENGKALAPAAAGLAEALDQMYRAKQDLELAAPGFTSVGFAPTTSKKIARLRGYVVVGIPTESSVLTFAPPKSGQKAEDAHVAAQLGSVAPHHTQVGGAADTQVAFRLRLKEDGLRKAPVAAFLTGEEGNIPYGVWGAGRSERGETAYSGLAITERQKIASLVVKVHRVVQPRRLYFELRDIPLGR